MERRPEQAGADNQKVEERLTLAIAMRDTDGDLISPVLVGRRAICGASRI